MNTRYTTVKELNKYYPFLKESAVRWLILNKEKNGFSKCLCKVGKKILIDIPAVEQWISKQNMDV